MITRFRTDKQCRLKDIPAVVSTYLKKLPQTVEAIGTPLQILRYEFPCEETGILNWLYQQNTENKIYWSDREGNLEVGGIGKADSLQGSQINYKKTIEYIEDRLSEDNPNLKYYGGFCFDEKKFGSEWKEFQYFQFIVPQFEFYREGKEIHFAVNLAIKDINAEFIQKVIQALNEIDFNCTQNSYTIPDTISRNDQPHQHEWLKSFQQAKELIQSHKLDKIVLARKSTFEFTENLNPTGIVMNLKKETPHCFHFCLQTQLNTAFLGASPERLYRRNQNRFQTEALAGTKPRSEHKKEDEQLEKDLLQSAKNLHEHKIVVDSIRQSAERFTSELKVDAKPQLLKLSAGHHLMTKIEGTLNKDISDGRIIESIHPTPAVAGFPVTESKASIRMIENFSRGWYAGLIGYVGFQKADFTVGIRSALVQKNQISLFSGAGIVQGSDVQDEWNEIEHKISTFLKIFNYEAVKRA